MTKNEQLRLKSEALDTIGKYVSACTGVPEEDIDISSLDDELSSTIRLLGGEVPEES